MTGLLVSEPQQELALFDRLGAFGWGWSFAGDLTVFEDAEGTVTIRGFNIFALLPEQFVGLSSYTEVSFDLADGNLSQIPDPEGFNQTYSHNTEGRPAKPITSTKLPFTPTTLRLASCKTAAMPKIMASIMSTTVIAIWRRSQYRRFINDDRKLFESTTISSFFAQNIYNQNNYGFILLRCECQNYPYRDKCYWIVK